MRHRLLSTGSASLLKLRTCDTSGALYVSMNAPPVNALTLELLQQLGETFHQVGLGNLKARSVILSSALQRTFSAGLHLQSLHQPTRDNFMTYYGAFRTCVRRLYLLPVPTLALVRGFAPAGGTVLALACDYRIGVEPSTRLGLNETSLAMPVPPWVAHLASRLRHADQHLLLGTLYDCQKSKKIGYVDEVISEDQTDEAIVQFTKQWQSIPPKAFAQTKMNLRKAWLELLEDQNDAEQLYRSIAGQEFQTNLEKLMATLKRKK